MTRAEFIKTYADAVAIGRRKLYPDIRLSEEAFSRIDDEKSALKLWKKHKDAYRQKTVEEMKRELAEVPVNQ